MTTQIVDPYLWLEDIESKESLEWVKKQNKRSLPVLENHPRYQKMYDKTLEILQSKDKIPYVTIPRGYCADRDNHVYNFWQDSAHIRGILRRTTIESYREDKPDWELILDLDKLSEAMNENWVYKGYTQLYPNNNRIILHLSRGGSDACVLKEFDIETKLFIDDGFNLPEAKSDIIWIDIDHVFVKTDFGPGSLTKSGYPRIIKLWTRGTKLEDAEQIFECSVDDVSASVKHLYDHEVRGKIKYTVITRTKDFYNNEFFLYGSYSSTTIKLNLPQRCKILGLYKDQFIISLREDWNSIQSGSICSFNLDRYIASYGTNCKINILFTPSPKISFESMKIMKRSVMVITMNNIVNTITEYDFVSEWKKTGFEIPSQGSLSIISSKDSNTYYVCRSDFLTPSTVFEHNINHTVNRVMVKKLPDLFDAKPFKVVQREAVSKDGTMIPYFLICRKDIVFDGSNPTILYGYGGFEVSLTPFYSGTIGNNWLKLGGVFVLANIRGGGEFGPNWHKAALKKNRMKCYEDFIGVAEDLIRTGVTCPKKLGIKGASNGGLLVGAVTMLRPDLFNAVICSVPLLDMKRYHLLLAGNSWIGEYGDPDDPNMWSTIKTYSPYQNIIPDQKYPHIYFTTSTKDDRVHPGHARKMVAKMQSMNYDVLYFENIEGGHAGAANHVQTAKNTALEYAYMMLKLMDKNHKCDKKRKLSTVDTRLSKHTKN